MAIINNNQFKINNVPASSAAKVYARSSNEIAFNNMMAARNSGVDGIVSSVRPDVSPALTMALNSLVGNYGIKVPPKMRIFSAKKGYTLEEGDERTDAFGNLLKDHPGVTELLSQAEAQAVNARELALNTVIEEFSHGPASASYDAKGMLTEFRDEQESRPISIVYDGTTTQVEELDAEKGWRPLKTESDFVADLQAAYNRYTMTGSAIEHAEMKKRTALTRLPGIAKPS
jgi:hypothetical protein